MGQGFSTQTGHRQLWYRVVPRRRPSGGGRGGGGGGRGGRGPRGGRQEGGKGRGRGRGPEEAAAAFPFLIKLFAPRQRNEDDIPIIVFDVYDDEPRYRAVMDAIKGRYRAFAPDLVGNNVPILPFPNPATGSSHFIIRLTNRLDPLFMVDLLICDTNMYFIVFRRHPFLSDDERAAVAAQTDLGEEEKVQIKEGPGTWYRCSDVKLSACLNTQGKSMGLNCSHGANKTTPGGAIVLHEIFCTLSRFEDRTNDDTDALDKAVQRIIVTFCEAARFRSICNEIARRIRLGEEGSNLPRELWKLIRGWDVLSLKVLARRLTGDLGLNILIPGLALYGFNPAIQHTVASLIGPEGELTLLLNDTKSLIDDSVLKQRNEEDSSDVADPRFPGHVHQGPQQGA